MLFPKELDFNLGVTASAILDMKTCFAPVTLSFLLGVSIRNPITPSSKDWVEFCFDNHNILFRCDQQHVNNIVFGQLNKVYDMT